MSTKKIKLTKKPKKKTWIQRLSSKNWRTTCQQPNCEQRTHICYCRHPCHVKQWVDLDSDNRIFMMAQHAHFLSPSIDQRRNYHHKLGARIVDKASFEFKRVVKRCDYLPEDVSRFFNR